MFSYFKSQFANMYGIEKHKTFSLQVLMHGELYLHRTLGEHDIFKRNGSVFNSPQIYNLHLCPRTFRVLLFKICVACLDFMITLAIFQNLNLNIHF